MSGLTSSGVTATGGAGTGPLLVPPEPEPPPPPHALSAPIVQTMAAFASRNCSLRMAVSDDEFVNSP